MARRANLLTSLTSLSLLAVTLHFLLGISSIATSYLGNTIDILAEFEQLKEFELSILYDGSGEKENLEWFFMSRGHGYGVAYRTVELRDRSAIFPILEVGEGT